MLKKEGGDFKIRLLKQILTKSLELHEEFQMNNSHLKSIYYFYHAYGMAINVLGYEDKNLKRKIALFKGLTSRYLNGELDQKAYNLFKKYMGEDSAIIAQALDLIDKAVQEMGGDMGDLDRDGELRVGILGIDFHQEGN